MAQHPGIPTPRPIIAPVPSFDFPPPLDVATGVSVGADMEPTSAVVEDVVLAEIIKVDP